MTPFDENLGYIYIAEETNTGAYTVNNLRCTHNDGIHVVEFDTILQTFGDKNRNQRYYMKDNVWEAMQTERILTMIKANRFFGEQDHPMQIYKDKPLTPDRIQSIYMPNRSHLIMNPHLGPDTLEAHIRTAAGSEAGEGFAKEIIANGLKPAFSCRAIATMQTMNGKPTVIVRRLITYDWVLFPSHARAEATNQPKFATPYMKESAGDVLTESVSSENVLIPLKEILNNIGHTDANVQTVMESFDLGMDNMVGFDTDRKHLMIRDNDNMLYINMKPQTKHLVDDFFASF